MSYPTKIATCCYCGTRAALVLKGKERHELACSACGAPLHDLKMLPKSKSAPVASQPAKPKKTRGVGATPLQVWERKPPKKSKKKKKRKSFTKRLFDEAFDVIEDIFD